MVSLLLKEGDEEPGLVTWREWLRKSKAEKEEELGVTEAMIKEDLEELASLLEPNRSLVV